MTPTPDKAAPGMHWGRRRGLLGLVLADDSGEAALRDAAGRALRNDEARYKAILERIPAGRWGEPDDFRGPAVFLASDAANYVHGAILTVDGGWMGR